jgi:hypothetical protein
MANEANRAVLSAAANGKNGHSLISDEKFRQLYGLVLRLQRTRALSGHEAAFAGAAADLRCGDALVGDGGEEVRKAMGAGVAEGVMPSLSDREATRSSADRIIAALAGAVAHRMHRKGSVTVIFQPGNGDSGVLREAHTLADRAQLPVLFVETEADGQEVSRRSRANRTALNSAMPSIPVDAQDVVAIYRVAHESIARARQGSGPTRVVCVGADAMNAGHHGAVEYLEHWLLARGLPTQEWRREIDASLQRKI